MAILIIWCLQQELTGARRRNSNSLSILKPLAAGPKRSLVQVTAFNTLGLFATFMTYRLKAENGT